jgi:hypothetical protein
MCAEQEADPCTEHGGSHVWLLIRFNHRRLLVHRKAHHLAARSCRRGSGKDAGRQGSVKLSIGSSHEQNQSEQGLQGKCVAAPGSKDVYVEGMQKV